MIILLITSKVLTYLFSTALMIAADFGKLDIVKYLVEEKSASLEIVNKYGK